MLSERMKSFYGKTDVPAQNIFRYLRDEPQSLDPQLGTSQPEARVYMALFEGLVEYGPKDMRLIPAIAEHWKINDDNSEFVFYLRRNARWSNGDAINAHDFVQSFRRGLLPRLASRNAGFGYHIRYAEAYNHGEVFVQDAPDHFLLEADFASGSSGKLPLSEKALAAGESEFTRAGATATADPQTPFHQLMHSPPRLTLPGSDKARQKLLDKNPKLKAAVAGKALVPVKAEDIGIEAVDDYTVRISLRQSIPFFLDLLASNFYRLVPMKVIKEFDERWTEPSHIVTCGPYKLRTWKPYTELTVVKDPMYWDAANVHHDQIDFYPMADLPSVMNVYKVGAGCCRNHTVPSAWMEVVRPKRITWAPEAASIHLVMNTTKAPMNDVVRRAFNLAATRTRGLHGKRL